MRPFIEIRNEQKYVGRFFKQLLLGGVHQNSPYTLALLGRVDADQHDVTAAEECALFDEPDKARHPCRRFGDADGRSLFQTAGQPLEGAGGAYAIALPERVFSQDAGAGREVSRLERADGSYDERLRGLAALRAPVGRFFDDVLVMAEDARLRDNRLGLMRRVGAPFADVADFRKIQAETAVA